MIGILFFMIGLALRGLFDEWAERAGWVVITLLSAGAAYLTFLNLPGDRGYPMLGVAIGVGCVMHLFGDMITKSGVPILWPIPTGKGRLWRMIGINDDWAIKVGGKFETIWLRGAFTLISLASAGALMGRAVLSRFNIEI